MPRRDERGTTVAELAIYSAILTISLVVAAQFFLSSQASVKREVDRSATNDAVRLAVYQIDRQVRSGNLFYDPSIDNDPANGIVPGQALRVYTQADAGQNAYPNRCVQWRIHQEKLQVREWSPSWQVDGYVTEFRTVVSGIVNRTVSPAVSAFALDQSQAQYGSRLLKVTILANTSPASGRHVRVESSITGRNTGYGYPVTVCQTIPPY